MDAMTLSIEVALVENRCSITTFHTITDPLRPDLEDTPCPARTAMSTVTSTVTQPSSALSSSVASLSASQHLPPNVARIYKQASQLFLTRRIQEAHEVLLPFITSVSGSVGNTAQEASIPIASASRGARVKVWNLYISIINEAIALGQNAGKKEFGSAKWKELVAKARDGSIWDEVVNSGYQGSECNVDGDIIASL